MADGDTSRYEQLKNMDLIEFYEVFDLWTADNNAKKEQLKAKKHGRK